jgi:glycosyltransferase involved in cell wall biosynthesis
MNSNVTAKSSSAWVDVLLATYNGGRHVAEQIESILGQDYTHSRIVVRDDGSSDGTMAIIRKFVRQYPEKIRLLDDSVGNVGSAGNFLRLIESSDADYAMLSDQDDVWLPNKISMTMEAMRENEEKYGQSTPILIHTDLRVTDVNLSVISDSFWKYQKISPDCDAINRLLVQNVVTGCTVMINRSLISLVRPASSGMIEHDWWLALIAASFGKIAYVPKPTILYRQHGMNIVGAVKWGVLSGIWKGFIDENNNITKSLDRTRVQAAQFLKLYEHLLPPATKIKILKYSTLHELSFFPRMICIIRYRFFKIGMLRNIGMMLKMKSVS